MFVLLRLHSIADLCRPLLRSPRGRRSYELVGLEEVLEVLHLVYPGQDQDANLREREKWMLVNT